MENDVLKNRREIVRYLVRQYLYITLFAFFYLVFASLKDFSILDLDIKLPIVGFLAFLTIMTYFFSGNKSNLIVWWTMVITQVVFSFLLLAFYGTTHALPYLSLITVIYSTSVIYGWKFARGVTIIFISLVIVLIVLHARGFNPLNTDYIESQPINTLVLCFFLWVNVNIARIGYQQIEHSYNSALEYSNKLELMNRDLDEMVLQRTKTLENSWRERVQSLEKSATIGNISSTLLHDLKTPLSSMAISLEMLKEEKKESDENVESLSESYVQVSKIIGNAESLMNNDEVKENFSVEKQIDTAFKLLRNISDQENVELIKRVEIDREIYGQQTLFLRVLLNLLVNSVEELSVVEGRKNKYVSIDVEKREGKTIIMVKDNGDGIDGDQIDQIFEPGFGTKHQSKHYGLGLHFVKETVRKDFDGDVVIESVVGEFTVITLEIPESVDMTDEN